MFSCHFARGLITFTVFKKIYYSIGKFLQFQLTVNVVAITAAVVGALSSGKSPLGAVQMLWVNMIMDSLGSIALATEPPTEALLLRKPYGRNDPVLSARMLKNVLMGAVYQLAVVFFLLYGQKSMPTMFMKYSNILDGKQNLKLEQCKNEDSGTYTVDSPYNKCVTTIQNSVLFNSFVMMQLFNEINARKLHDELNVFDGFFKNPVFSAVILITTVLQILIMQFGGIAFEVLPLNSLQWGVSIAFGVGMLPWGVVMHLVPPFYSSAATSAGSTIIHGAQDDVIKDISQQVSGIRPISSSKRLESASSNYRIPTATSTRVLSQARRQSNVGTGFPSSSTPAAGSADAGLLRV